MPPLHIIIIVVVSVFSPRLSPTPRLTHRRAACTVIGRSAAAAPRGPRALVSARIIFRPCGSPRYHGRRGVNKSVSDKECPISRGSAREILTDGSDLPPQEETRATAAAGHLGALRSGTRQNAAPFRRWPAPRIPAHTARRITTGRKKKKTTSDHHLPRCMH